MKKKKRNIEVVAQDEGKQLAALKTTSILAGKQTFLIEKGKEVPKGIPQEFLISLINSNLIK